MNAKTVDQAPKNVTVYQGPTLVRFHQATRFLWGDDESQHVNDYIYGKNERIGCVVFTLRPGGFFKVSSAWKPFYKQHRFYYVVSGQLAIHDPETGHAVVANPGEAVHWRGAKWHFGYNFGPEEVFVLDWYAPQERPQSITEMEFNKTKPVLGQISPGRGDLLRHWPEMLGATRSRDYGDGSIVKLTPNDTLNFVQGEARPVLERLYVSTEELTGGVCTLMPGHRGENRTHPGEKIIFALNGRLNVYLPDTYDWFELHEKDALYLPSNTVHQCWNYGDKETSFAFKLVPTY